MPTKRILFVGAPFGQFFRELAERLEDEGAEVYRIVLEGGDWAETPARNRIMLDRSMSWARFLRSVIRSRGIQTIVTYNDTLPRNRIALSIAKRLNLTRLVLENGYLRPHHVTLAQNGVNGNSELSCDPAVISQALPPAQACKTFPVHMRPHVMNTIRHFLWSTLLKPILPYNSSYYGDSVARQGRGYIGEYCWRALHNEDAALARVDAHKAKPGSRLYLVLMQKPGDGQIRYHSPFGTNSRFLEEVLTSFAESAPDEAFLVVKQHPLDYGIERLPQMFASLTEKLGIQDRAVYMRKAGIAGLMERTNCMITINSTGGLQGVMSGIPVKCLGKAVYDVEGLTFQGPLADFWSSTQKPDPEMIRAYRNFLLMTCQLNGGFHTQEARAILLPAMAERMLSLTAPSADAALTSIAERRWSDQPSGMFGHEGLVPAE
ncbi:capsular biosynthesis protein [Jiella sp. MQZ9-1]|uniref:Capsular biosynthesis protein n=1 Tax=Jiella flava TaxID=2816857 RepID=A0A939FZH3_9HYPH|nr:capsular biosynthesis protein [Jiella flava]MBO0663571.1 capsular biosynthesis protein [Jiella flava]MCD2472147.1 capsular biosynthesis protein [Jiella flava]